MEHINNKVLSIRSYAKRLKLSWLSANVVDMLLEAGKTTPSYDDFLDNFLCQEVAGREERQRQKRLKEARLPMSHDLNLYDHSMSNGLSATQLNQLREIHWVEEGYNLMLAGPSGVGKTYIAAGLCADAINRGYKTYFRTMDEIIATLKMKDITPTAKREYKSLCEGDIIVIDDLMNIIVGRDDGNLLFAFINGIFESVSFIITTNRSPAEWAQSLNDEVLAAALLDRLLYKCELIQLSGSSYRMKNRKRIFTADAE
jgi:DNA replication protein DnaC